MLRVTIFANVTCLVVPVESDTVTLKFEPAALSGTVKSSFMNEPLPSVVAVSDTSGLIAGLSLITRVMVADGAHPLREMVTIFPGW